MTYLKSVSVAVISLTLLATLGKADTIYTYTGKPFNQFFGGTTCPPECNNSVSFDVSTPLGPNFEGYFSPDSFSFTDGVVTITQANATFSAFGIITDPLGAITAWNLGIYGAGTEMFIGTGPNAVLCPSMCSVTGGSFVPGISGAEIVNDPLYENE